MTTTSLKLSDELKGRITAIAEKSHRSPHALMLDLLEQGVAAQERRQEFVEAAVQAKEKFDKTRSSYELDQVFAYFDAKAQGLNPVRPVPKKWPR